MSRVSSSPMSVRSSDKENTRGTSGKAAAKSSGNSVTPSVELNATVISLIEENEGMIQTIASLKKENAVMKAKLEHVDQLEAEVNALRAELGYVTADTTDTKYRVQNYKKLSEQLQATLNRLEEENEMNKNLLEQATAKERASRGPEGFHGDDITLLKKHTEQARKEVLSALRMHKRVLTSTQETFDHLKAKPTPSPSVMKEELEGLAQRYAKYCSQPVKDMRNEKTQTGSTLRLDVVLPVMEWSEEVLEFSRMVVGAYADAKMGKN